MQRLCIAVLILFLAGCPSASGPLAGITSPSAFDSRTLRIRNLSAEYIVVRLTAAGLSPLTTPTMPPGAEQYYKMLSQFGTLCPDSLRVEIAAYARVHPELSPLVDETLETQPFAATQVELLPGRDYGCVADTSWLSLNTMIDCSILDADAQAGRVGFQAGWVAPQQQAGVQISDPPAPSPPAMFPLRGDIINSLGQPLAGVEVRMPQLGTSIYTDANGQFSVLRPTGTYVLEPVLPGIEVSPALQSFSHVSDDEVPVEFIALTDSVPSSQPAGG